MPVLLVLFSVYVTFYFVRLTVDKFGLSGVSATIVSVLITLVANLVVWYVMTGGDSRAIDVICLFATSGATAMLSILASAILIATKETNEAN